MTKDRRRRVFRVALAVALVVGAVAFMAILDDIFGPLLFALLFAYILNPAVNRLARLGIRRPLAIGLLFLFFYAALFGLVLLTVPAFISQAGKLYEAAVGDDAYFGETPPAGAVPLAAPWEGAVTHYVDTNVNGRFDPGYARQILVRGRRIFERLQRDQPEATAMGLEQVRDRVASTGARAVDFAVGGVAGIAFSVFGILALFVLVPIYLFYFLMGFPGFGGTIRAWLPVRHRERISGTLGRIDEAVSAFFRGRLLIMGIKAVLAGGALAIVGVPFGLVIGILTGLGSLIPLAGFLIGLVPAVALALLDTGSPGTALLVAGIFVAIEVFENYFLMPQILKDRTGLHPVTLLVSVFVGEALFGFVGMIVAIPLASVGKILFTEYIRPEVLALVEDGSPPAPSR
ncbi:MAG: AI-2E family transporter [Planctomycetes bacterium]|jgi:predicted PurR-regulated permease PerM|nr:AI-2E family transporter [Planctomycetota bacterium]